MGIGVSIFLVAIGAILRYAITVTTNGVNLHTVGDILMIVGVLGGLVSLIFWSTWGGWGSTAARDTTYIGQEPPVTRRHVRKTVVREED